MNTKQKITLVAAVVIIASTGSALGSQWNIKCDAEKRTCGVYSDHPLSSAHVHVITREVYPGVNPNVVKIGKEWHVRFTYKGVLKELKIVECGPAQK